MILGGLQKTTLIDFPGKIAATVFTSGCNFFCPWCYSAELVLPGKIEKHPRIPEEEFFDFLKTRQGLLEGVAICGGEPTCQKDLPDFIRKIKDLGFAVKLDTNGSNPEMLEDLINKGLIDYVAMDIKLPKESNIKISNLDFRKEIEKSADILKNSRIGFEFRTTVVPTIHKKEDFLAIAKWIGGPGVKYYLQGFRPEKTIDPSFEAINPYPDVWLSDVKKEISPYFKICEIRG
jgi:pyruvate formate lyase activating enzyme